jgi:CheY-like chemotaxis protein
VGEGSTCTLYVPLRSLGAEFAPSNPAVPIAASDIPAGSFAPADDRDDLDGAPFVLIVEDDPAYAGILFEAAHDAGLKAVISTAGSGTLALARRHRPNAITLDLGLADIDGFVLLDLLQHDPATADVPIYCISGAEHLGHAVALGAKATIQKPVSRERLLELFGKIAAAPRRARKPAGQRGAQKSEPQLVPELAGRRILIIDDDIRNIYSLTSVLEAHDVEVEHAESGADGIRLLQTSPGIDVALVDIMMPDMDGYETMRQIRSSPATGDIPLIAVTAKAMKGDRQKCLDAGASDYIAKPVDVDLLLALLRVWIGRVREGALPRARVEAV